MVEPLRRLTPQERDLVARTIVGEAANQGPIGMKAVAAVIGNRMASSGRDAAGVVLARHQFEPWGNATARARMEALTPDNRRYQEAMAAIDALAGGAPDPTAGATHFYAPRAQAALGRRVPSWDNGRGVDIGDHRFFRLGYGGSGRANPHGIQAVQQEPPYRPQAASADAMMGHESPAPSADAMMGHPAAPVPRDGISAIAAATGGPGGLPPSASAFAGSAPTPQPRPRQTPEQWQKTVFQNNPNTGNEAVDFNLQQDAINRGYASWQPGLNSPNPTPPQQNPMDMIRGMFPQPSQQNNMLAQLLSNFGGS